MKDKINEFLKLKYNLKLELEKWVIDKSIPLDKRWTVFVNSGFGNHVSWCTAPHFYFDIYMQDRDRHETLYSVDILDYMIDEFCHNEGVTDEESLSAESQQEIINFKEAVLEEFLYSFENDW